MYTYVTLKHRPTEFGTMFPVSRAWNFVKDPASGFRYVLFDWDNFFATFLAAADDDAKNASYSNLIQIVKARTYYHSSFLNKNYRIHTHRYVERIRTQLLRRRRQIH